MWELLADAAVVAHLAYIAFLPLGGLLAWRWRRLVPIHLAAVFVGIVSVVVLFARPANEPASNLRL